MRLRLGGALCVAVAAAFAAGTGARLELVAGAHRIDAEVADTPASRAAGLMYRDSLAADQGMLFVYPEDRRHCMWMRNTVLPLAVAFIDAHGEVINVTEMAPQSDMHHCAATPARYALEMNAGWFGQHGIEAGMRIDIPAMTPR